MQPLKRIHLCQFTWKNFHGKLLMKPVIDREDFILFHLDKNKKSPPKKKKTLDGNLKQM